MDIKTETEARELKRSVKLIGKQGVRLRDDDQKKVIAVSLGLAVSVFLMHYELADQKGL